MYKDKPKNAIVYLRVSTDEQVENYSLGTQEEMCQAEALRRKVKVVKVFKDEGKSAKTIAGRPALLSLLSYCSKHKKDLEALIVYRVDRLSRQTEDYIFIRKKLAGMGISLYSVSEPTGDTPMMKYIETMFAMNAQFENDLRAERSRVGMKARFTSGKMNGKPPLGYKLVNKLAVRDEKTWDIVKEAWDLMATGLYSTRGITDFFCKKGVMTAKFGIKYRPSGNTAHRLFRNPFYTGRIYSPKYDKTVNGIHEPMVSNFQFNLVQNVIDKNRNSKKISLFKNKDNPDFPYRRLVKCGGCGGNLTGAWSQGSIKKHPYYQCLKNCKKHSIQRQQIHDAITDVVKNIKFRDEVLALFHAQLESSYAKRKEGYVQRRAKITTELKQLKALRNSAVEKNLSGIYSDEIYQERIEIIEGQIKKLSKLRDDTLFEKYSFNDILHQVTHKLEHLDKTVNQSNLNELRVIIGLVFKSMVWKYEEGIEYQTLKYINKV